MNETIAVRARVLKSKNGFFLRNSSICLSSLSESLTARVFVKVASFYWKRPHIRISTLSVKRNTPLYVTSGIIYSPIGHYVS